MAMRGRSGRGNPGRTPRLIVGRVYEQFKPWSEWRQEDDSAILLVYLPGFQKQYIKVTTEDLNTIRVRGERLVAENKWTRFQDDFRVPDNCEMKGIQARFESGILTITMPRKTIDVPTTAIATQVSPKANDQEPPLTSRTNQEVLAKPKQESSEEKTSLSSSSDLESKNKSTLKTVPETKEAKPNDIKGDVREKYLGEKTDLDEGKGKEGLVKEETKKDMEGRMGKWNKEEGDIREKDFGEKTDLDKGKGKDGLVKEETKKKEMEGRMGKWNKKVVNEDRKTLVNIGVGVLVIVALGVQVSYTIGLIGKRK